MYLSRTREYFADQFAAEVTGNPSGLIGLVIYATTNQSKYGWFRRGVSPWLDLVRITSSDGTVVNSYHRCWSFVSSGFFLVVAIILWKSL
jgi:Zn-dependent protease with chaperone function